MHRNALLMMLTVCKLVSCVSLSHAFCDDRCDIERIGLSLKYMAFYKKGKSYARNTNLTGTKAHFMYHVTPNFNYVINFYKLAI